MSLTPPEAITLPANTLVKPHKIVVWKYLDDTLPQDPTLIFLTDAFAVVAVDGGVVQAHSQTDDMTAYINDVAGELIIRVSGTSYASVEPQVIGGLLRSTLEDILANSGYGGVQEVAAQGTSYTRITLANGDTELTEVLATQDAGAYINKYLSTVSPVERALTDGGHHTIDSLLGTSEGQDLLKVWVSLRAWEDNRQLVFAELRDRISDSNADWRAPEGSVGHIQNKPNLGSLDTRISSNQVAINDVYTYVSTVNNETAVVANEAHAVALDVAVDVQNIQDNLGNVNMDILRQNVNSNAQNATAAVIQSTKLQSVYPINNEHLGAQGYSPIMGRYVTINKTTAEQDVYANVPSPNGDINLSLRLKWKADGTICLGFKQDTGLSLHSDGYYLTGSYSGTDTKFGGESSGISASSGTWYWAKNSSSQWSSSVPTQATTTFNTYMGGIVGLRLHQSNNKKTYYDVRITIMDEGSSLSWLTEIIHTEN